MGTEGSKLKYDKYIGGGASGEVFKVVWQSKSHPKSVAAAKKIRFQGEIPDELKREIGYLKKLDHKNIIKYYDTLIEEHHVVIVTEYAAKGSLYHYLKDQTKLPDKLLHIWMYHLISGIDCLQQSNIAHRDIKSPNCVITADDELKICDFGIARDLSSTTDTSMKGSYRWLAPEVIKDQKLSPKSEIFAFAIIVWEMVTCEEPYKDSVGDYVKYNVCNKGLRPQIPADCPHFLKELMEKCWHEDRRIRPTSDQILQKICLEYKDDLRGQKSISKYLTETDGLEWKLKHVIKDGRSIQFVAYDRLAICEYDRVDVHQVTKEATQLLYSITCDEWKDGMFSFPKSVAVSDSMPDSILVICFSSPYVYQFPRHTSSVKYVEKYQIHDGKKYLWCIAANANTAVICLCDRSGLVVCGLPGFTNQRIVNFSLGPHDLCITSEYLVVMGYEGIAIRSLGNMDEDVCRIHAPDVWECKAVSYRNDARQLYVACYHEDDWKGAVYKYTWDGNGTPQYVNTGCVIDNLDEVWHRGMSISTDGLLAVSQFLIYVTNSTSTRVFSLE